MSDIQGFDFFDVEPAKRMDPVSKARQGIAADLGGGLERVVSATTYVKPTGLSGLDHASYLWDRQGWAVVSGAANRDEALKIGKKVQSNFVSASKLAASDPYVHTLPLFVIYGGKWVKLEPVEKKAAAARTAPSLSEQKRRIVLAGEEVFGSGSIRIAGTEGEYILNIEPTLKKAKRMFAPATVKAGTIEGLAEKMSIAVSRAKSLL